MIDKKLTQSMNSQAEPSEKLVKDTKKLVAAEADDDDPVVFKSYTHQLIIAMCCVVIAFAVGLNYMKSKDLKNSKGSDNSVVQTNRVSQKIYYDDGYGNLHLTDFSDFEKISNADDAEVLIGATVEQWKNPRVPFVSVTDDSDRNYILCVTAGTGCNTYIVSVYGCSTAFVCVFGSSNESGDFAMVSDALPKEMDFDWDDLSRWNIHGESSSHLCYRIISVDRVDYPGEKPQWDVALLKGGMQAETMEYRCYVSWDPDTDATVPYMEMQKSECEYIGDRFVPEEVNALGYLGTGDLYNESELKLSFDPEGDVVVIATINDISYEFSEKGGKIIYRMASGEDINELSLSSGGYNKLKYLGSHMKMFLEGETVIALIPATYSSYGYVFPTYTVYYINNGDHSTDSPESRIVSSFEISVPMGENGSIEDYIKGKLEAKVYDNKIVVVTEKDYAKDHVGIVSDTQFYFENNELGIDFEKAGEPMELDITVDYEHPKFDVNNGVITQTIKIYVGGLPIGDMVYKYDETWNSDNETKSAPDMLTYLWDYD